VEEIPEAYKDVAEVVDVVEGAGISRKVACKVKKSQRLSHQFGLSLLRGTRAPEDPLKWQERQNFFCLF
jgi:hypothetical protein